MSKFYVGQELHDVEDVHALPTGTILVWGEPGDEDVAIVEDYGSRRSVSNTAVYYMTEPYVINPPYRIVRLGLGT